MDVLENESNDDIGPETKNSGAVNIFTGELIRDPEDPIFWQI